MTDLLSLRIVHIQPELSDNVSGRFEAASYFLEPLDGRPVTYQAGQFLTLLFQHHGRDVRRSYSLSSAPAVDNQLRLTIKRVANGELSRHLLDTLQVGDVVTSLPPAGRFTLSGTDTTGLAGDLLLFGAGSGITPLFSLLKQALYTHSTRRVTLLYSNANEQSILFQDELAQWQRQYAHRFRLVHLLSRPIQEPGPGSMMQRGRLNNVALEQSLPELIGPSGPATVQCYVCGPEDYMRMVRFTLVFSGIDSGQIRRENFVIEPVAAIPSVVSTVDWSIVLQFRGQETVVPVPARVTILQAALNVGITLPYSCRGGRCSTCSARCVAGRVEMTINDVLTERDLAEGWVLTCTGYPADGNVIIEA